MQWPTASRLILDGFSNGGSFAAKLYCRGETFDGRLVGVVRRRPGQRTRGSRAASPTSLCTLHALLDRRGRTPRRSLAGTAPKRDWTCEGGVTIGIDAYAAASGTEALASPFDDHQWHLDAPELTHWRA